MFGLGAGEIFIVFALALILIGPKKLPELARGLGKAIREFQNTKNDLLQEVNDPTKTSSDQEITKSENIKETKSESESIGPISKEYSFSRRYNI